MPETQRITATEILRRWKEWDRHISGDFEKAKADGHEKEQAYLEFMTAGVMVVPSLCERAQHV